MDTEQDGLNVLSICLNNDFYSKYLTMTAILYNDNHPDNQINFLDANFINLNSVFQMACALNDREKELYNAFLNCTKDVIANNIYRIYAIGLLDANKSVELIKEDNIQKVYDVKKNVFSNLWKIMRGVLLSHIIKTNTIASLIR